MQPRVPLLMLFLSAALSLGSCSDIPENNDPVIGVWSNTEISNTTAGKAQQRQEWIFNDAYLGRYHQYTAGELTTRSDFSWEKTGPTYTIEYPGLDRVADVVTIKTSMESTLLLNKSGDILARRE